MGKRKLYGSLILNIFVAISVIVCTIILIIGSPRTFRMFTTETNLVSGIISIIIIIFEILIILKKRNILPNWLKILKMISTTGVALTFFVVVFYLGFVAIKEGYSYFILFRDTNFFFHFLTPLASIISFILFEGSNIKFKYIFLNLIHMILYSIFYFINVFTHLDNGKVSREYDWYYFILGENWTFIIVLIGVLLITFFIGFLLWIINKKINNTNLFKDK